MFCHFTPLPVTELLIPFPCFLLCHLWVFCGYQKYYFFLCHTGCIIFVLRLFSFYLVINFYLFLPHVSVFLLFVFLMCMWWDLSLFCCFLVSCPHQKGFPYFHKWDFPFFLVLLCFFFLPSFLFFNLNFQYIWHFFDERGRGRDLLCHYFIPRWQLVVSMSVIV